MPQPARIRWHPPKSAKGKWRSDVGPLGKGKRRTPVYFEYPNSPAGRRAAELALEAYLRDRDRRDAAEALSLQNPTVFGLVVSYLRWFGELVARDERSARTLRSHAERLRHWVGPDGMMMDDRSIRGLGDDDATRFLADLKAQGCGPRRRLGILRSVNACLNWAADPLPGREPRRILEVNPFKGVKVGAAPKTRRQLVTRAELARFLRVTWRAVNRWTPIEGRRCSGCVRAKRVLPPGARCRRSHARRTMHDRALLVLIRLQGYAGTRPSELCRATWGPTAQHPEIGWQPRAKQDPNGHWWGLLTIWGKTSRVTGQLRRVPVPPILVRAIERIRRLGLNDTYIFPRASRTGSGLWDSSDLSVEVKKWRDAAGLGKHVVLYGMRHRWYTQALHRAGLTGEQAGAVGGTSGQVVRDTYLQEDEGAILDLAFRAAEPARAEAAKRAEAARKKGRS
jgi:integrase